MKIVRIVRTVTDPTWNRKERWWRKGPSVSFLQTQTSLRLALNLFPAVESDRGCRVVYMSEIYASLARPR